MSMPTPNVSKPRRWLWELTFVLLVLATIIWGWIFRAGHLLSIICGVSIILFMGFYAEYMEYRERREHEGPIFPSRAERRRALRQRRKQERGQSTRK